MVDMRESQNKQGSIKTTPRAPMEGRCAPMEGRCAPMEGRCAPMEGSYPRVADFYQDSKIFLTGGTGFLGKVLLFSLLRHFPGIDCVYMLVRHRRGISPEKRIEQMFENEIFDRLKKEAPSFMSKIKVVEGDLEADNIGLSPADYAEVSSQVSIIFHCAATLKFDEELKVAIRTNLCSTQTMVGLARNCPNLRLFTYVSTAYSNANLRTIEEKVHTPVTHYSALIRLSRLGEGEEEEYEEVRKRLATENVNTYTLTKAAAEQLISEEATDIPVSIFRPSIVIASSKDPVPGYIDNMYGPTGIVAGVLAGVVRVIYCDWHVRADVVPVDMTVNALVCSSWLSAHRFTHKENDVPPVPVFNYVSSTDNPINWHDFIMKTLKASLRTPYSRAMWSYSLNITGHMEWNLVLSWLYHYPLGFLMDLCAPLTGNKLRLVSVYRKLEKVNVALEPFSKGEWNFHNQNIHAVWNSLTQEEQLKFSFNINDIDWDLYLESYMKGILVHQLKDKMDPESRKYALRRYKRLEMLHQSIKFFIGLLVILFFWKILGL